ACVITGKLDRPSVFDALHDRRCYATTNARILLDFSVNGQPMGREIFVAKGEPIKLSLTANACAPIERIEVISGSKVVRTLPGSGSPDMAARLDLGAFAGTGRYYYLRLTQADGHRAWTSPVWLGRAGTADLCIERKDIGFDHASGALTVRARNYGDTAAKATLSVHSSAKSDLLVRHEFGGRANGVAIWVEPISDTACMLRLVIASALRQAGRGEFACSGKIAVKGARGYSVALDRRGVLTDDGKGGLSFSEKYGMFFKWSQSRAGSVSPLAIRIDTTKDTTAEVSIQFDGKPCTNVWLGPNKLAPGQPAIIRFHGLAAGSRIAKVIVDVPPNGGTKATTFDGLKSGVTYLAVLDPDNKIPEIDERNNAAALAVSPKAIEYNPWPEHRGKSE
ncbi:hypothetical protein LCGC14_2040150, partial [marine sediment metagenome]